MLYDITNKKLEIEKEIKNLVLDKSLKVIVLSHNPSFASQKYIALKAKKAQEISVNLENMDLTSFENESRETLENKLKNLTSPYILQLPVDPKFDWIVSTIPQKLDVDLLNPGNFSSLVNHNILPPTIRAIFWVLSDMLNQNLKINQYPDLAGKTVLVIGQGKLVGTPLCQCLLKTNATIISVNEWTLGFDDLAKKADIVISAVGKPGVIDTSIFKPKAIVIDAATAESNGQLVGDIDKSQSENLFLCPTPGGVGGLTIVALYYNLYLLKTLPNSKPSLV